MNPVLWTLAIVGPLCLAAVGTFVVFVISIHRTRRASLFDMSSRRRGAVSRGVLITTRNGRRECGE